MSKSRKSYSQLCKELQALKEHQTKLEEEAINLFVNELMNSSDELRFRLADSTPNEIKKLANKMAPALINYMNANRQ